MGCICGPVASTTGAADLTTSLSDTELDQVRKLGIASIHINFATTGPLDPTSGNSIKDSSDPI